MEWTAPNTEYPPPKPGEPELFRAARVGDHAAIRHAIEAGADLNAVFDIALDPGVRASPATPLMVAAGSGDGATVDTVQLLISLGAAPSITSEAGSAAGFACRGLGWNYRPGGDVERLRVLLDSGNPLVRMGRQAARLVADTASTGDAERLDVLLAHGMPCNPFFDPEEARRDAEQLTEDVRHSRLREESGELPEEFQEAIQEEYEQLEQRLATAPFSFEIPLFAASKCGSAECVKLLLAAGADVTQADNTGHTALFLAGSPDVVYALAAAGIDLNHTSEFDRDALQEKLDGMHDDPVENGRIEAVCRAMLKVGVPLVFQDQSRSRLWHAAFAENRYAVHFLLDEEHSVMPGSNGETALHAICWNWDHGDDRDEVTRAIVRSLLQAGIEPLALGPGGQMPLHEAMSGDGVNLVAAEELIAAGADVNAVNDDGDTPLMHHYQTLFDYEKVVPFLLERGANPLIRNKHGDTAIDLARQMIRGDNPQWRIDRCKAEGGPPCEWKERAKVGDAEHRMLALLEKAASQFEA